MKFCLTSVKRPSGDFPRVTAPVFFFRRLAIFVNKYTFNCLRVYIFFLLGEITLEELDEKHMDMFEWMCNKLDNGRWGFRHDYKRLAAQFDRITKQQRVTLKDEALWGGSPSHRLMSLLQNVYPNLPLRYLVHSLRKIGRNDIAKKLTNLILDGNYGASGLIEEGCSEEQDSFVHIRCYPDPEMEVDYSDDIPVTLV